MRWISAAAALVVLSSCGRPEESHVIVPMGSSTSVPPVDREAAARLETATFAVGWFWTPDARFGTVPGIRRTRVGYAGGSKRNPTYHDLGDHTESFQVDFDPTVISYDQLLDLFWESHNPCDKGFSKQYMSAVFVGSEDQKRAATESKARLEKKIGQTVRTPILPLGTFTLAEDYHQKYYLRNSPVMREFEAIYPDAKAFTESTAAARANGFLAGDGEPDFVKAEVERLGLSPQGRTTLLRAAGIH